MTGPAAVAVAFEAVCADLARRLRRVCAALPPAEFDALVVDMARLQLRWQRRRWGG